MKMNARNDINMPKKMKQYNLDGQKLFKVPVSELIPFYLL